jgi:hypothetical protein
MTHPGKSMKEKPHASVITILFSTKENNAMPNTSTDLLFL